MQYVTAYFMTAVIFFALDMVWLVKVANGFYRGEIGNLLLEKPALGVATGFYLVFVAGIVFFAIHPALRSGSVWTALLFGCLFGFFTYATYDMTNLATLKGWTMKLAAVDIVWGTVLSGVSAWGGCALTRWIHGIST